jgi:hypothetical protein
MCRSPHSLLTQPANCRQRRWVPDGGAGATAVSLRAPQPPSLSSRAAKRDTSGGGASPPELARRIARRARGRRRPKAAASLSFSLRAPAARLPEGQLVNNQVAPSRIASTMTTTITIVTVLRLLSDSLSNMRLRRNLWRHSTFASPRTNTRQDSTPRRRFALARRTPALQSHLRHRGVPPPPWLALLN